MALYRYATKDDLANLKLAPTQAQTQIYDMIGRSAGTNMRGGNDDNFFAKRGKSIENAIGTTGAAIVSGIDSARESAKANSVSDNIANNLDKIAQKYGFADRGAYWDAISAAEESGNTDELNRLDTTVGAEMRGETSSAAKEADQAAKDWKDYRENSYVGQKINQDRGKFLGSAINTLSTGFDVMAPGAGILANSLQGGIEGIADELEQDGLQNFDWERAGQNALTGAATGAVTGALNKGISSKLAKNGGNLFKGSNVLTRGLNNLGSQTAAGRIGSTLATGATRGAVSGAVGGATGAGLSAAMNGQDVLGSAIQGAQQGFGQGALAGGVMTGANMVASKTPGIGTAMQKFNKAGEDWNARKANGESFGERLANTWDESTTKAVGNRIAESKLGQRIGEDVNAVKQGFQDVGQGLNVLANRSGIKDVASADIRDLANIVRGNGNETILQEIIKNPELRNQLINVADNNITGRYNEEIRPDIVRAIRDGVDTDMDGFLMRQNVFDDSNNTRIASSRNPYDNRLTKLYAERTGPFDENNPVVGHYRKHENQLGGPEGVVNSMQNIVGGEDTVAYPGKWSNTVLADNTANQGQYPASVVLDKNGGVLSVSGRTDKQIKKFAQDKSDLFGSSLDGRSSSIISQSEDVEPELRISGRQATDSSIPQNAQDVNALSAKQKLKNIKADSLRTQAAKDLLSQVGTVPKSAAKADNMVENVKKFMDSGLTRPEEWQLASDAITGSNGVLSEMHRNLVGQAGDIDTFSGLGGKYGEGIGETIDYFIKSEGLVDSDAKGIKNEIMAVLESLPSRRDGSISMADNAADVMTGIRELESHRRNYLGEDSRNLSTTTPYKDQKARVIKKVTSMLEDRIYDKVPDATRVVTPEAIQELKSLFPNNEKWARNIDDTFAGIKTGKDLRAAQKQYVQTSDYLKNINENFGTYGQRVGDAYDNMISQGLKKIPVVGGLLAQATNTPAANRLYANINSARADRLKGNPIDFISSKNVKNIPTNVAEAEVVLPRTMQAASNDAMKQANGSTTNNPATQIYNMIGRTEGLSNAEQARTADYLVNAAQEAEVVPNGNNVQDINNGTTVLPNDTSSTSVYNALTGGSTNNNQTAMQTNAIAANSYFPTTGDYWTDILGKAMSAAIEADDVAAFASLYGMYQDSLSNLQKNNSKDYSNPTNWNSSDRSKLLSAQNAMDQIDQLESAYNSATGGQGGNFLQGNLRSLAANISGGNLDASANNYNKLAESVGMGIVKNLINLGVTEADAKRYLEYLPALTDTKEQAAQKLDTLRNIYQSQINNLYSAYGV